MESVAKQLATIQDGSVDLISVDELTEKLKQGKPLTIKLGADPTAPDLHLGHAVVLQKLKEFQDLGHTIVFLIGDFTARIGDPTGKSKTRPPLTEEKIAENTVTYFEQVGKILNPAKISIRYNSEWLDKLSSKDVVEICSKVTLARIIERDDFKKRFEGHVPIGLHELLYPLFQAYDSVALKADVELGGTDQLFNFLLARYSQEQFNQKPQVVLTMPLLEGLDGVEKMSKSLGNYIGLSESAEEAYGKLMSISDKLMWRYFAVLLRKSAQEVSALEERVASGNLHPKALKKEMAHAIIAKFWSPKEADLGQQHFEALFEKKDYSQAKSVDVPKDTENPLWIVELLKICDAIKTTSEAKRLIEAGAVKVDGNSITDFSEKIAWKSGMVIKVGKHRIYSLA